MIKKLLVGYLCLGMLVPAPVWAEVMVAQPEPAVVSTEGESAKKDAGAAEPTALPEGEVPAALITPDLESEIAAEDMSPALVTALDPEPSARKSLLERFTRATWQFKSLMEPTIPGLLDYWKLESHALFDPFYSCAPYYSSRPTDFLTVATVLKEAQSELASFLESRAEELGRLKFEFASLSPVPPQVVSESTGQVCQPILRIDFLKGFSDKTGVQPEQVSKFESLVGSTPVPDPYFYGLSKKTAVSPLTDNELMQWMRWVASLRKMARLYALYISAVEQKSPPALPEFIVSEKVGSHLQKLLFSQEKNQARAAVLANQLFSLASVPGKAPQFVPCDQKDRCEGQVSLPSESGYCFCDGKERDARLADENIVATLQSRKAGEAKGHSHGVYLDAMRKLGIKSLMTQLATANSYLPRAKRYPLPQACVAESAGDIKSYTTLFESQNQSGFRFWWVKNLVSKVGELVESYQSGTREIPVPRFENVESLFESAHALSSDAVSQLATALIGQGVEIDLQNQIEAEKTFVLGRMGAAPFDEQLSQSRLMFAELLGEKLKISVALLNETWIALSEKDWEERNKIIVPIVAKVVQSALVDALEVYVGFAVGESEVLPAREMRTLWQQQYQGRWQALIEKPIYQKEMLRVARQIVSHLNLSDLSRDHFNEDEFADEEADIRVAGFAESALEASLTDIPEARAASVLPSEMGVGTQDPVFFLDPSRPDHQLSLAAGLAMIGAGHKDELIERLGQLEGYQDDQWIARNFYQKIRFEDGSEKIATVRGKDALANAIIRKFEETVSGDPDVDTDLQAKKRADAFRALKHYLVFESPKAERDYNQGAKGLANVLYETFLRPLIAVKPEGDAQKVWRAQVGQVLKEIQKRDVIIPVGSFDADALLEYLDNEAATKKDSAQLVAQYAGLLAAAADPEGELRKTSVIAILAEDKVPGQRFAEYCLSLRDKGPEQNCLKWLAPLTPEYRAVLTAAFEARVIKGTEINIEGFLDVFGKGGWEYPGIDKLESLSKVEGVDPRASEDAIFVAEDTAEFLFEVWHGYLDTDSERARSTRESLDAFLVELSKIAHADTGDKSAGQLIGESDLKERLQKDGITSSWLNRMDGAYQKLQSVLTQIDEGSEERLIEIFPDFRMVVSKEYEQLGLVAIENLQVRPKTENRSDLASYLLPSFYEFRETVLDDIETLSVAHKDPVKEIKKASDQITFLTKLLDELHDRGADFSDASLKRHTRNLELNVLKLKRARRRLEAYQRLEKILNYYLPENAIATQTTQLLAKGSYSFLWEAYFEDQFLNTQTDAEGKALPLSPKAILSDLNKVAQKTQAVSRLSFYESEIFLKALIRYLETAAQIGADRALEKAFKRRMEADQSSLKERAPLVINAIENGDESNSQVLGVMNRLVRLVKGVSPTTTRKEIWESALEKDSAAFVELYADWEAMRSTLLERAKAIQEQLSVDKKEIEEKAEAKAAWVSREKAIDYFEVAQLASDLLFASGSEFGPLVDTETSEIVWFNAPALNDTADLVSPPEVSETETNEENKESTPEVKVPVTQTTAALIAISMGDFPRTTYETLYGDLLQGPSVFAALASEDRASRIATVYQLDAGQRRQAYDQIQAAVESRFGAIFEALLKKRAAAEAAVKARWEALSEDAEQEEIEEASQPQTETTQKVTEGSGQTPEPLVLTSSEPKAEGSETPEVKLAEVKKSENSDKQKASDSSLPDTTSGANRDALDLEEADLYFFSEAAEEKNISYEKWRDDLRRLLHLWKRVRSDKDETALQVALGEEIFTLFFLYLPYQYAPSSYTLENGAVGETIVGRIELPGGDTSERSFYESAYSFYQLGLNERFEVIEEILARFAREETRVRLESVKANLKQKIEKARVGSESPSESIVLAPFAPGNSAIGFRLPENGQSFSPRYQLLQFYATHFAPQSNASRLDAWVTFYQAAVSKNLKIYDKPDNQFTFRWSPIGVRTTQAEQFHLWVTSLAENPVAQKTFESLAKSSELGGRIWDYRKSLDAFVDSPLYAQLVRLLDRFDENAKYETTPGGYPFMLASLNWKINRYGRVRDLSGPLPKAKPLRDIETSGLLALLVDEINMNLKDFGGWEDLMEATADAVHDIVAQKQRFLLAGVSERRFANTSVSSQRVVNPNIGPDYEARFFPVMPNQRKAFEPAESWEAYQEIIDRPATYLRYRVNDSDRAERPLYQQLTSVQGRMVGMGDISEENANVRNGFVARGGDWSSYSFGNNYTPTKKMLADVSSRSALHGVEGISEQELSELIQLREQYIDFVDKVSQLIQKYPYEGQKKSSLGSSDSWLTGNSLALGTGNFINGWLGWASNGWVVSPEGETQLDAMLESFKVQTGWDGSLSSVLEVEKRHRVARAIWLASLMTKAKMEKGLTKAQIADRKIVLSLADAYFADRVQRVEYKKGVHKVAENILPRLEKLCEVSWVKNTHSDEEFEKVKELIKESNILYYDNLAKFVNEFTPEGDNNETYRKLLELRTEKSRAEEMLETAGHAVHVLMAGMVLNYFAGNPLAMASKSWVKQVGMGMAGMLINAYFGYHLYNEMSHDYWGAEERLDFMRGHRDTVIADYTPLISDEQGATIDLMEKSMLTDQRSSLRWSMRIFFTVLTVQMMGVSSKFLHGGLAYAMSRVKPQWLARWQFARGAKALGLDVKSLEMMSAEDAVMTNRQGLIQVLEKELGSTYTEGGFKLSESYVKALQKDVRVTLRQYAKDLKLDPKTLEPIESTFLGRVKGVDAKTLERREDMAPLLEDLLALERSLGESGFITRDDLVMLLAGKNSPVMPGIGHPVHRHMPGWMSFTGYPAKLYAQGPTVKKLGALYRAVEAEQKASNMVAFHLLGKWREKFDRPLREMAKKFSGSFAKARQARLEAFNGQKAEVQKLLESGKITQARYEKTIELLKTQSGQTRSDMEELLAAFLESEQFGGGSVVRTVIKSEQQGVQTMDLFTLGSTRSANQVTDEMRQIAREFREICKASGVNINDNLVLSALAERNYVRLTREFTKPSRVIREASDRKTFESVESGSVAGKTPGTAKPQPPGSAANVSLVPDSVLSSARKINYESTGIELSDVLALAVKSNSAAKTHIKSILELRLSSADLQAAYGKEWAANQLSQIESEAFQVAIEYTRAVEVSLEAAQMGRVSAPRVFESLHRVRLQKLAYRENPSLIEAKAIFHMDVHASAWSRDQVLFQKRMLEGSVDEALLGKAEQTLLKYSDPDLRQVITIEDFCVLTDLPEVYLEIPQVLGTIQNSITVRSSWMGRSLSRLEAQRLNALFNPYDGLVLESEARHIFGVSRNASKEEIREAAQTMRQSLERRLSPAQHRAEMEKRGLPQMDRDQIFLKAQERVNEAERLLLERSSKSGELSMAPGSPKPAPSAAPLDRGIADRGVPAFKPEAPAKPSASRPRTPKKELSLQPSLNDTHVQKFVGAGRMVSEATASQVAQEGYALTEVRVLEASGVEAGVQDEVLQAARLLRSGAILQEASAAKLMSQEMRDVFPAFLNPYVLGAKHVSFPITMETARVLAKRYLEAKGIEVGAWDLEDFRYLTETYAQQLMEDNKEKSEAGDNFTPERERELYDAYLAWNTLTNAQGFWFSEGAMEYGHGLEEVALTARFEVPLEVLLQEEVLRDTALLGFILAEDAKKAEPAVSLLQSLFAEDGDVSKIEELLSGKKFDGDRLVRDLQARWVIAARARETVASFDLLLAQYERALKRLEAAGVEIPELPESSEGGGHESRIITP